MMIKTTSLSYSVSSLAFVIIFGLAIHGGPALAQQTLVISSETSADVQVNLNALAPPTLAAPVEPRRIVDGKDVIILVPPNLQKKDPPQKIVRPRIRPGGNVTKIDVASKPSAAPVAAATTKPVPRPPVNPAKLPKTDPAVIETALADIPDDKLEAMVQPAAGSTNPALPTAAEATAVKEDVAEKAAEKVAAPVKEKQAKEEIQVASIAPAEKTPVAVPESVAADIGKLTRILFEAGDAELPASADPQIVAIAEQLAEGKEFIQLIAHASGDSTSAARRLSLDRALAIRSKLLDLGVGNSKIEVRALGMPTGSDPVERVDLVLIAR